MYKWILKSAATAGTPLLLLPMNFRKHMSGEYLRYVEVLSSDGFYRCVVHVCIGE